MGFVADEEQPQGGKFVPDEPAAPAKRPRVAWGDAGAALSASDALGGFNHLMDRLAYGAGEKVSDAASKVLPPEGAAGAGYLANLGVQTVPMFLGGGASKAAPVMENAASRLMQSALKPTLEQLKTGDAARAISTMLDRGFNATKGGVANMKTKIGELNEQIADAIANSPATIDKAKVTEALKPVIDKFEKQVNPNSDVSAIEKAWTEFLNHPLLAGAKDIPVQLAQKLKQGTYAVLKGKYGEAGSAATEAQKGLARGLKEGIADAVPAVAGLNKEESALINALNVTERRALLDANKNPNGLALLAHNPATWAAFMADKSALFKSIAARMLNAGSERIPGTFGQAAGAAIGAQSGLPEDRRGVLSR